MARTLICVTQQDIDAGRKYACGDCPVALAIKRHFPNEEYVIVGISRININNVFLKQSTRCRRFISKFDNGGQVKPFKFYLER